jgi:hypothetical protein
VSPFDPSRIIAVAILANNPATLVLDYELGLLVASELAPARDGVRVDLPVEVPRANSRSPSQIKAVAGNAFWLLHREAVGQGRRSARHTSVMAIHATVHSWTLGKRSGGFVIRTVMRFATADASCVP